MMELLHRVLKKNSGQSLLEAVIASGMILIVVGGLVAVVVGALKNSQFSKNQALATKYGSEAMEKVRVYRDQHSWNTGVGNFVSNCSSLPGMGITAPPSPFTRTILCTSVDSNKYQVQITVSWTDSSGTHQSRLSSYFTNQSLWK